MRSWFNYLTRNMTSKVFARSIRPIHLRASRIRKKRATIEVHHFLLILPLNFGSSRPLPQNPTWRTTKLLHRMKNPMAQVQRRKSFKPKWAISDDAGIRNPVVQKPFWTKSDSTHPNILPRRIRLNGGSPLEELKQPERFDTIECNSCFRGSTHPGMRDYVRVLR